MIKSSLQMALLEFPSLAISSANTAVVDNGVSSAESCMCSGITNRNLWLRHKEVVVQSGSGPSKKMSICEWFNLQNGADFICKSKAPAKDQSLTLTKMKFERFLSFAFQASDTKAKPLQIIHVTVYRVQSSANSIEI
jgi:hypothetical protein